MSVHRVQTARVKRLRTLLEEIIEMAMDLGGGADLDADPSNTSPENMAAHIAGLIVRRCLEALDQLDRRSVEKPTRRPPDASKGGKARAESMSARKRKLVRWRTMERRWDFEG